MVEPVLVAMQASSEWSNSALGNGTELQHRRVLTRRHVYGPSDGCPVVVSLDVQCVCVRNPVQSHSDTR